MKKYKEWEETKNEITEMDESLNLRIKEQKMIGGRSAAQMKKVIT